MHTSLILLSSRWEVRMTFLLHLILFWVQIWPSTAISDISAWRLASTVIQSADSLWNTAKILPHLRAQCVISTTTDHEYATPFTSRREGQVGEDNVNISVSQPAILSVIPCMGPLRISLNGRETVFKEFIGFFENIYIKLFPWSYQNLPGLGE